MKLLGIIEEQLLQNLRNKVQNVAQNVGDKFNSMINKNQEQRTLTSKSPLEGKLPSVEYKEFVDKWKPINQDKTKLFGFGESSGINANGASRMAFINASSVLSIKLKSQTTSNVDPNTNIRTATTVSNNTGSWPIYDESSYGIRQDDGNYMWYYAVVVSREPKQQ